MQVKWENLLDLIRDGLPALCEQHWAECKVGARKLSMDWERYANLELNGVIFWVGVREEGKLVGYASICVTRPLHHKQELDALTDTVFLAKEHRKGLVGWQVIKRIMLLLVELKIEHFTITERLTVHRDFGAFGKMLERLGAELFERNWIIKLGEKNG